MSKARLYYVQSTARVLILLAASIAGLTLLGYLAQQGRLVSPWRGWQGMSILTATAILLVAIASWRNLQRRSGWSGAATASIAMSIALAVLGSHAIDRTDMLSPWLADRLFGATAVGGRVSVATALGLGMLSVSALAARFLRRRAALLATELGSNAALLLGGTAILGYLYRISDLYGLYLFNTMSLQSALAVFMLAIAQLIGEPDTRLGSALRFPGLLVARQRRILLLPALPVVIGWLLLHSDPTLASANGAAIAILVIATCVPMFYLLLENAHTADQLEREQLAQRGIEERLTADLKRQLAAQSEALTHSHDLQVQALASAERAKRSEVVAQLTGTIAHDFNNLLMVIGGSAQLLKMRMRSDTGLVPLVDKIATTVNGAAKLTAQLSAFSRTQRLQKEPVVIDAVLASALAEIRPQLAPGLKVDLALDAAGGTVLSDWGQLELALLHVMRNASEAMPGGGTLTIRTALHSSPGGDQTAVVHITDSGAGIGDEAMASVLEPFYTTKQGGHAGLGLAQVNSVVHQASGTLQLSSSAAGTTVQLCFPCTHEHPEASAPPAPQRAVAADNRCLLVIDDDDEVRAVIVALLRHLHYEVCEADNGERGLQLLDQVKPALAIIDYLMPGMNGAEVARKVRGRVPGLPIIFISGYADSDEIGTIPESRFLRKPVVLQELERTVSGALVVG